MRAALLKDDVVVNLIEYDPETNYEPPPNCIIVDVDDDEVVEPGYIRESNGGFLSPGPPMPPPISEDRRRIKALEAAVDQLILDQLMGA